MGNINKLKAGKDCVGAAGGVLIFNEKKEILLMKRGKKSSNNVGFWSKPGGAIEFGETGIAMAKREIKEETNIEINIWGELPHTDHIIKKEGEHWLSINFLANYKKGKLKIMEPEKCSELKWFVIEKIPKKLEQTTREAIKNYLAGKYIKL
jgi:8-oxo-dGTP diphosphatase